MKINFRVVPCLLATGITIISAFLFRVPSVYSQSIGLSIRPVILEVMIKPGKSITQAYQVANNSNRDLYVTPKIVPFTPRDVYGNISLRTTNYEPPAASFFSLQNSGLNLNQTFKLPAGKSQQLVLKLDVPQNNPEKDYYYTFLIEQTNRGEFINQTGGQHRIKIGSNILMIVSETGEPQTDFQIAEFKAEPKFADLFDKVKFRLLIQNTGSAFFKPQGRIEIYNTLFNKKVGELNLLPENILVDSARKIRCKKEQPITSEVKSADTSEVVSPTACSFSSWLPGKYKAIIASPQNNQQPTINNRQQANFYLIPYKLILALAIIILITWQIYQKIKSSKPNF